MLPSTWRAAKVVGREGGGGGGGRGVVREAREFVASE